MAFWGGVAAGERLETARKASTTKQRKKQLFLIYNEPLKHSSLKKGSCEKIMKGLRNRKISPNPSFPKRGTRVEREELPSTYRAKFLFLFGLSPFEKVWEKGGRKGDLNFFTDSGEI
ncbi:MAG: hypothetical protein HY695_01890 [Deltaproteobacteria bacterium]|nr:hypothetical protein [Deltaproteobacteria bacterium]